MRIALAIIVVLSIAPVRAGEVVSGEATVIDGDTIVLAGKHVRLFGIDAPERNQTCTRGGVRYYCGQEATASLRNKIAGRRVTCEEQETDVYGRSIGICTVGSADLGKQLVQQGRAVAYHKYSPQYANDEAEAKLARRGLWAGQFEQPEKFRHPAVARTVQPVKTRHHTGNCQDPDDRDSQGHRCGERSSASRPSQPKSSNFTSNASVPITGTVKNAGAVKRTVSRSSHSTSSNSTGKCQSPDDKDSKGRRCGKRSSASRAGGR